MMDYEMFRAVVKEKFLSYMPEEYRDAAVEIQPAKKINRTLDALTVFKDDDSRMSPTIYVNDMYEHYRSCGDLEAVLLQAAGQYTGAMGRMKSSMPEMDMGNIRDNVVMCLVNTEQNRELLADVPNKAFQDLSVIYRWVVNCSPDAMGSVVVSNKIAEEAGITEEELFRCAVENTRRINPVAIARMSDILGGIPIDDDIPEEIREGMEEANRTAENMWIIGNSRGVHGAVSMLYEENLHELAEQLGDDLFILPSSIHEVIAVPAEMAEKKLANMTKMVHDVNMGSLRLEERLSNSVYHYDRNARKVTLAAESPEKRLDGKQAELPLIQEDNRAR